MDRTEYFAEDMVDYVLTVYFLLIARERVRERFVACVASVLFVVVVRVDGTAHEVLGFLFEQGYCR